MHRYRSTLGTLSVLLLASAASASAAPADEARSLNELRNTVVNLLQGLVDRGVLTKEQAEKMVRDAQSKAEADAAATAAQEKAEENAVRVPYVPQVVKDEIRKQVEADVGAQVTQNVVNTARVQGWGVPAALPDWVRRMNWSGDVRVRGQGDFFASDNATNAYFDFQRVNQAGGIGKAGLAAFANTSLDRDRMRARLRLGFDAELGSGWTLGARLTTGSLTDPVSTNQTLGNMGYRYQTGLDLAYIDWTGKTWNGRQMLKLTGGRIRNPYLSTDLVFDQDLTFEGVATQYRVGLGSDYATGQYLVATVGAFPLQEIELAHDKWLFGSQLALDWNFENSRWRIGAAYYDYVHTAGQRNSFESQLLDYTAPVFMQRGNTLFDIRNDNDPNTNLFALAADYRIADLTASVDWRIGSLYRIGFVGDALRNIGYDSNKVFNRTGFAVEKRNKGYQGEISFGFANMSVANAWRATVGYRYLQRDAVLDAFTDSDFRLGGTDVQGYYLSAEYALTPRVIARARYLSGNEIDGPPLGIDVLQLDLTASF